jgi:hypothetical protein
VNLKDFDSTIISWVKFNGREKGFWERRRPDFTSLEPLVSSLPNSHASRWQWSESVDSVADWEVYLFILFFLTK